MITLIRDQLALEGNKHDIMQVDNYDILLEMALQKKVVGLHNKINWNLKGGFYPQNYGMKPAARSSACWKGYKCDYIIIADSLIIDNLYISDSANYYPEINGADGQPYEGAPLFDRVYTGINLPIDFSGTMNLDGEPFKPDIILVFETGKLVEKILSPTITIMTKLWEKSRQEKDKRIKKDP